MELNVLIVEDDRLLLEAVADYFGSKGWEVTAADDGEQAMELLERNHYHLILLDVMMPGMNGFSVCREIRKSSDVPVIFITARVLEEDELNGYALGADDYVTKPFSLPVLHAKAMALLGRVQGRGPGKRLSLGKLEVDLGAHEVFAAGCRISLPPKEYEMLVFFLENPNRIYSREQLLIRFWGYDFEGNERVVDNHIKKLRSALGSCGDCIKTIRKSGYRLEVKR
ncbi:MAG: response regulator transcription factor [Clostridiales bacterium]|nr:response regulator transcription factor [Clostridiales bacterium]